MATAWIISHLLTTTSAKYLSFIFGAPSTSFKQLDWQEAELFNLRKKLLLGQGLIFIIVCINIHGASEVTIIFGAARCNSADLSDNIQDDKSQYQYRGDEQLIDF